MAITYKATFRPEKRKDKGSDEVIAINVPLMLDLNYHGRCWYNTGIRLQNIEDFDLGTQSLKSKTKAYMNRQLVSATKVNEELGTIKAYLSDAFNTARALKKPITAKTLIQDLKKLSGQEKVEETEELTFLEEFEQRANEWLNNSIIGDSRRIHYRITIEILTRFLKINKKIKIKTKDFSKELIGDFRDFLFEEYKYIDEYPELYSNLTKKQLPKPRSANTVSSKLKGLKAFFTDLEDNEEIDKSPFSKIRKKDKRGILSQKYAPPIFLKLDELLKIVNTKVPENLQRVKDCFLLHCALGSRIEEFNKLTWKKVNYQYGFYYIRYKASKAKKREEPIIVETPLVKFAADIIEKYKNKLPGFLVPHFAGNSDGHNGYNSQIKKLLEYFEIDRPVFLLDQEEPVPLYTEGSSKICRKTHIDITTKVELNKYASGLHREKSKAVDHYTQTNIEEKFILYCKAFNQPKYKIKENSNG